MKCQLLRVTKSSKEFKGAETVFAVANDEKLHKLL